MRYAELQPALQMRRVESVDTLRGLNFACILGGDGIVWALGEMSKGKGPIISAVGAFFATQFTHATWEGFRFYDFIFPLFLFLTGVSIVLSLPRLVDREGKAKAHLRVLRRALVLYLLGLFYYGGLSAHWGDVRLLGVLQRIALCYLFASLMFLNLDLRGMIAGCVALLVGYWALLTFVPVPGVGVGSYAPDANLADWIDLQYLPGRLFDTTHDPEGMLSTLPAIASCLLGVFAGLLLRDIRLLAQQKTLWLVGTGVLLLAAGYLWALQFPIIKGIWTSSFVLVAGGYSAILLGAMHQVIDVWGVKRWSPIFVWIGANAITLYMLNNLVDFRRLGERFAGGDVSSFLDRTVTPGTGSLAVNVVALSLVCTIAGLLYRRKIFVRV
jgi:predicted acyltransferase